MNWVALKMLTGDRAKYLGIIFGVMFASLLISHQLSIFCGILGRTYSRIYDIHEPDIWVMDPMTRYIDEIPPLSEAKLQQVRGVPGVDWAVKLYVGQVRARMEDGSFRSASLLGVDDASLIGAPVKMLIGTLADLKEPDAVVVDKIGYAYMWPNEPLMAGEPFRRREFYMNYRRAVLVGVCEANAPFQSLPILYTRYSQAIQFAPPEFRIMSFVLVKGQPEVPPQELCHTISQRTGLKAVTREQFQWSTVQFYLNNTGIPVNFGITVMLGFIVGVAIAGQTFYLFTLENLKQFGALKAMGLSNSRIVGMIMVQALTVGVIGYSMGMGLAAMFFEYTKDEPALQGFFLPWQIMVGTAAAVGVIVVLACLLSIRKVLVLEPAIVFR